jgi:hypothetical protein
MKLPKQSGRVIRVPVPLVSNEIGLGDAIKRVTSAVGVRPCAPCEQRAAALNRRIVIKGRAVDSRRSE